ncbi:UNVERIFIED_CONTAM: hypothetical protein NCL1_06748, partial [Trichonephila clavipes]
ICERITNVYVSCGSSAAIIKEPIRGRWFATREDIANIVRQQVTRFTHGAANAEAGGIQRFPHRWQSACYSLSPHVVNTLSFRLYMSHFPTGLAFSREKNSCHDFCPNPRVF